VKRGFHFFLGNDAPLVVNHLISKNPYVIVRFLLSCGGYYSIISSVIDLLLQ